MSANPGHVFTDDIDDSPATEPGDWENAIPTSSLEEVRQMVVARRARGPNKQPTKEQVAVRYSPDVLAYFRSTGPGWQTRMDEVLREYVSQRAQA